MDTGTNLRIFGELNLLETSVIVALQGWQLLLGKFPTHAVLASNGVITNPLELC
ncbi:hypothetical protein A2U01_0059818, partial [Trifolium medium]|nr:hypothetical protein [Trifolium medium]